MNRSTLFAWTILFCTCVAASASADPAPPPAKPFSEKVSGTLVSLEMLPIPAGRFVPSTAPDKAIEAKPFFISKTEITWDLFSVYAYSLDRTEAERSAEEALEKPARSRPTKPYGDAAHGHGTQGYPAISMTFKSANGFCTWLSAKTGRKYRLPTELEWEYAARAGGPLDVNLKTLGDIAWHKEISDDKTHPVAELRPNAWGLHDTLGNVAEWCTDADGKPVTRGGSHRTKAKDFSFARRDYEKESWNIDPQDPKSTWWFSGADFVGFRVVCEE